LLLQRLAELDQPSLSLINQTIEELSSEREPNEPRSSLVGATRAALDSAFRHNEIEQIVFDLTELGKHPDESINTWASSALSQLQERSPTSLKVALTAIRKGKNLTLRDAFEQEMNIAGAFCVRSILSSIISTPLMQYNRAGQALISRLV
jgi:3-hydroxyisobutyryl-CoA hydrolase